MKGNFFLAILALALALSAFIDRRTAHQPEGAVTAETATEPLFPIRTNEIAALRARDEHRCVVLRTTEKSFAELLNNLINTPVLRRFSPVSPDLAPYGLAYPNRQLEVLRRGESQAQTVFIGMLNPSGDAVYMRTQDDPGILLVGSYFLTVLDFALQRAAEAKTVDPACADFLDELKVKGDNE